MIWPNEAVIKIGLGGDGRGGFDGLLFDACGRNLSGI
jgi:hypothetical protein